MGCTGSKAAATSKPQDQPSTGTTLLQDPATENKAAKPGESAITAETPATPPVATSATDKTTSPDVKVAEAQSAGKVTPKGAVVTEDAVTAPEAPAVSANAKTLAPNATDESWCYPEQSPGSKAAALATVPALESFVPAPKEVVAEVPPAAAAAQADVAESEAVTKNEDDTAASLSCWKVCLRAEAEQEIIVNKA